MKLQSKTIVFITISTLIMTILLTAASILSYRSFSISSVQEQSRMAAEIIRVTLTEQMLRGVIEHRDSLFARLKHVPGLTDIHIVRGEAVKKQFGPGLSSERAISESEEEVLITGKTSEQISEGEKVLFHYTIPYKASVAGTINCMQCHEAGEGEVLGAISLGIDLTEQRRDATQSVAILIAVILIFVFGLLYFLRRLLNPIVEVTTRLQTSVMKAEQGNFSDRLAVNREDEIGEIADQTNHLMATLERSIGTISREVEGLSDQRIGGTNSNQLERTVEVVHSMVQAAHFKQMVESDRNLEDVYIRLKDILKQQFSLKHFSLYEVSQTNKKMSLVFVEGLPDASEMWCEAEVLIDSAACRAKRTAQTVSSVEENKICTSFRGNAIQDKNLLHVCIPMMLGGSVGAILQVIFTPKDKHRVAEKLSTIQTYLREIAPVIETKRLMQSLRDASMRDAMTGLYNRRFLEEYVETLTASASRSNTGIGVLMCDVDFFKQVNDTLGHEVGDTVLKGVAKILKREVRASDLTIRFGGEEFLALLVDTSEKKAMEVAERIRSALEEHSFQTPSGPLKKTLSVGVAMYPNDTDAFWECVKFADVAMYEAKETGRNKILRFDSKMWKTEGSY